MAVRILLVEDDAALLESLLEVLQDEGYSVQGASGSAQALQLAAQQAYDLVITDIRMSGKSGLDALEEVRHQQPHLRSLVITGYSTEADSIRAIQLGVGAYLKKPFDIDEFLQAVRDQVVRLEQERRIQEREGSLRKSALWAFEKLGGDRGREAAGRADRLARRLGLDRTQRQDIVFAVLVHSLDPAFPHAPASVKKILRNRGERWDGTGAPDGLKGEEIPLGSRVLAAILDAPGEPGQLDPQVLAWLEQDDEQELDNDTVADTGLGLLALGKALEQAGAWEESESAYRQAAAAAWGKEACESQLGLARLLYRKAEREPLHEALKRARTLAAGEGPVTYGRALAETAALLGEPSWLEQGLPMLNQAGDSLARAWGRLVESALAGNAAGMASALGPLLQPGARSQLLDSLVWLWPRLLQQDGMEPALLARLAKDCQQSLQQSVECGLPPQAREKAQALLQQAAPERPSLHFYSLGSFYVEIDRRRAPENAYRTGKTRLLLAYLAAYRARPVSDDVLVDVFWGDHAPEKARQSLWQAVSSLRKVLGAGDRLLRLPHGLQLNPELEIWHDVEELRKCLAERDHRRTLELYRGPYLEGCYMDWALALRGRLEQSLLESAREICKLGLEEQRPLEVSEFARRALEVDPCCQDAHYYLVQAHLALGRPEDALRQLQQCKRILLRELDMEPAIRLLELEQRALLSL